MIPWDKLELDWENEEGLLAVGGDLEPASLLGAYSRGIFPWYNEGDPILWWSPDPRSIFELDDFYISKRLARTIRQGKFQVTFDTVFHQVMAACGDREEGTWVTPEMLKAYTRLHEMGVAHSVEAWLEGELVGGTYGVALGGFFAAESMFHRVTDAGKVALAHLVERLKEKSFTLLDTQVSTDHTRSLGAIDIPRKEYLRRLRKALPMKTNF